MNIVNEVLICLVTEVAYIICFIVYAIHALIIDPLMDFCDCIINFGKYLTKVVDELDNAM